MTKTNMVPVPSLGIIPERDVNSMPILDIHHLGIGADRASEGG